MKIHLLIACFLFSVLSCRDGGGLRPALNGLSSISENYEKILAACSQSKNGEFDVDSIGRLSRVGQSRNLYETTRKGTRFFVSCKNEPPHDYVIACTAETVTSGNGGDPANLWAVQTAINGYVAYPAEIPPVPGCRFEADEKRMWLTYPEEAIENFREVYPEMVNALERAGYKVPTSVRY